MLNPSYSSLIQKINEDNLLDNKITSRYSIVIATAKRARQIVGGAHYDAGKVQTDKAVSIAVHEMERGHLRIVPVEEQEVIPVISPVMSIMDGAFALDGASTADEGYDDGDDGDFEGTADEAAFNGDDGEFDNDSYDDDEEDNYDDDADDNYEDNDEDDYN